MNINRLEERRRELNLSQDEVIKYVGICKKSYYRYEAEDKPIPSDKLIKLSEILKCTTDYLLGLR